MLVIRLFALMITVLHQRIVRPSTGSGRAALPFVVGLSNHERFRTPLSRTATSSRAEPAQEATTRGWPVPGLFFTCLLLLALAGAACGGSGDATPDQASPLGVAANPGDDERVLRVGVPFRHRSPAPPDGGFLAVRIGIGETLFRLGKDLELEPWLATGAQSVDENTWEVTLRQGVKFHDGTEMDAAAVKASLERAIAEAAGTREALDIARIEVSGPFTLTLMTNEPNPILLSLLTERGTVITNASAAEEMGDAFLEKPVLTGPFKVEEFNPDRELVLTRHEGYWGALPEVDRLVLIALPDNNSRMLALQSGDIDIAEYISPESAAVMQDNPDLAAVSAAPATLVFMYLNQRKEPWDDVRVRQAVSSAADREALLQAVVQDHGVTARGPLPPTLVGCDQIQPHAFDPARSRELLAQAGYQDRDGDGYVEKDGQTLTMTLLTYRQRPELPPLAEALQASLKDVGIRVEIRMVEQITSALELGDWDGGMYFNNMVATGEPYGVMSRFFMTGGPANYGSYSSPRVDELTRRMARAPDRETREQLACEASETLVDEVAVVPLLHPDYNWGVSQEVTGFEPHPYHMYAIDHQIGRR